MQINLRGELTSSVGAKMEEFDLVDAVARSMHLSTPEELGQMCATLFPAMINTAVREGDIIKVAALDFIFIYFHHICSLTHRFCSSPI